MVPSPYLPQLINLVSHGQENETPVTSDARDVVGTPGYIAPESRRFKVFTTKSDVYSFGIMALEVVCKRPPHVPVEEEEPLVKWVWRMHEEGQLLSVMDVALQMKSQLETDEVPQLRQVTCVLHLGILCTMRNPSLRPRTERLLHVLKDTEIVPLPTSRTG